MEADLKVVQHMVLSEDVAGIVMETSRMTSNQLRGHARIRKIHMLRVAAGLSQVGLWNGFRQEIILMVTVELGP